MSIIHDAFGDYEWVLCPACLGTGNDPQEYSGMGCLMCDGSGEVRAYLEDGEDPGFDDERYDRIVPGGRES